MSDPRCSGLAQALAEARLQGTRIPPPSFEFDLDAAYLIQEQVADRLGGAALGWKVGSTSKEAQARLGTEEPGAGRILDRFAFAHGGEVPVAAAHDAFVEVEFAFRMGAALPARPERYLEPEVAAAAATLMPAMEIVGSRYESGLSGSGRNLVTADGGANIAFVAGPERPFSPEMNLPEHRCTLHINGHEAAAGNGARALGNPLTVLTWLANHLSKRGLGLSAGALVSTGTCTGLVRVQAGDLLAAEFGALGRVEARLVSLPEGPKDFAGSAAEPDHQ